MAELWDNLLSAAQTVEACRRAVNEGYSDAPETFDTDFRTALDQIADQLYLLNQAWVTFVKGDVGNAEKEAARAAVEAQRVASIQWRNLAEHRKQEATDLEEKQLPSVQTDISDILDQKSRCDNEFKLAAQLHEQNDPKALEALRKSTDSYTEFIKIAKTRIVGTATLSKRERRRQLASYIGAMTGVIALIVALIGRENIINFLKSLWNR